MKIRCNGFGLSGDQLEPFALCKEIQVALGFQIPALGSRIPDPGSRILSRGFRIPNRSLVPPKWIMDSIKICEFWITYNGIRNPDSFTSGETSLLNDGYGSMAGAPCEHLNIYKPLKPDPSAKSRVIHTGVTLTCN